MATMEATPGCSHRHGLDYARIFMMRRADPVSPKKIQYDDRVKTGNGHEISKGKRVASSCIIIHIIVHICFTPGRRFS